MTDYSEYGRIRYKNLSFEYYKELSKLRVEINGLKTTLERQKMKKVLTRQDIYDFAGWLTKRSDSVTISSTHECSPLANLADEYCIEKDINAEEYAGDLSKVI